MTWNLCAIQNAMAARVDWNATIQDPLYSTKNRLYWSIFVRDRILWLGRHRSPHFTSVHFKPPINFLTRKDLAGETGFSCVYNAEAKGLLVEIFRTQCQLAMIITDVIAIAFASYNRPSPRFSVNTLNQSLMGIKELRKRLNDWRDETQSLLFQTDLSQQEAIQITTKLIWLHYQ